MVSGASPKLLLENLFDLRHVGQVVPGELVGQVAGVAGVVVQRFSNRNLGHPVALVVGSVEVFTLCSMA